MHQHKIFMQKFNLAKYFVRLNYPSDIIFLKILSRKVRVNASLIQLYLNLTFRETFLESINELGWIVLRDPFKLWDLLLNLQPLVSPFIVSLQENNTVLI